MVAQKKLWCGVDQGESRRRAPPTRLLRLITPAIPTRRRLSCVRIFVSPADSNFQLTDWLGFADEPVHRDIVSGWKKPPMTGSRGTTPHRQVAQVWSLETVG
jgi:hypothetical protein